VLIIGQSVFAAFSRENPIRRTTPDRLAGWGPIVEPFSITWQSSGSVQAAKPSTSGIRAAQENHR
jgi:hypothetical protein